MRASHDTEPTSFNTDAWFFDPLGPINLDLRASTHLAILERLSAQTRAQIFTHASFDNKSNYEDFEFIGDSIVQVASTVFLDERYLNLSKGENNAIRMRIVGRIALSQISLALGFQSRIQTGPVHPHPTQAMMEDVVEALLGGIYRDQGLDEAIRWGRKLLEAIWERSEDYFVRDEVVRRRYGLPAVIPPPNPSQSKLSPRSAPSPSAPSSSLPTSHRPSRRTPATADHSKDELTRVCTALRLNVCYEAVSTVRMPDGGSIWTERVKVGDGRYQAEGSGWTLKSAQNAAVAKVLQEPDLSAVPKKVKRARLR